MSQCVPSWALSDNPISVPKLSLRSSHSNSSAPDVSMLDYQVAELTWENGQLAMHGLGPTRVPAKPIASTSPSKYTWDKPRASGTLESIVNQATCVPQCSKQPFENSTGSDHDVVRWFNHHKASASATLTMDALVPCSNQSDQDRTTHVIDSSPAGLGTCLVGCSTRVGSCSAPTASQDEEGLLTGKRARVARVPVPPEWSRDQSVNHSATFGEKDSQQVTVDSGERELGVGFTSTSYGSQENTSSGTKPRTKTLTADHENDSVCHSRPQREVGDEDDKKKGNGKSSVSTKRSRAAAIHNQSERKRRDKINQKMKTLQKLVPNSSKTDKASMLDEVIEYLKQLQAQVQMISRMNMQPMMLPLALQQQLQMSMMAPMSMGMAGMGMGMGMGVMDMNTIAARSNMTGIPPVLHPTAFIPMATWDGSSGHDRLQATAASATVMSDPLSAFLACQPQPMTMDTYSRMAAMCQQLHQQPRASNSKS